MLTNIKGILEGHLQASQRSPRGYPRAGGRKCPTNIEGLLAGHRPCRPTLKDYWKATCKQVSAVLGGTLGLLAESARPTVKDYWKAGGHADQH